MKLKSMIEDARRIGIILVSAASLDIIFNAENANMTNALIGAIVGLLLMSIAYIGDDDE